MHQTLGAETLALRQILHAEETLGHRMVESDGQNLAPATELVASPQLGGHRCAKIGSLVFFFRRGKGQKSNRYSFIRTVHHDCSLLFDGLIQKGMRDFETYLE